jgi:hypothetical protein
MPAKAKAFALKKSACRMDRTSGWQKDPESGESLFFF